MVIARTFVHLGIPSLKEQSFAIIFLSTNYFGVFKVHIMVILLNVLGYLGILIIIFNSSFMFFYSCFQCSVSLTIISKITSGTFNFINDVPCTVSVLLAYLLALEILAVMCELVGMKHEFSHVVRLSY